MLRCERLMGFVSLSFFLTRTVDVHNSIALSVPTRQPCPPPLSLYASQYCSGLRSQTPRKQKTSNRFLATTCLKIDRHEEARWMSLYDDNLINNFHVCCLLHWFVDRPPWLDQQYFSLGSRSHRSGDLHHRQLCQSAPRPELPFRLYLISAPHPPSYYSLLLADMVWQSN